MVVDAKVNGKENINDQCLEISRSTIIGASSVSMEATSYWIDSSLAVALQSISQVCL